MNNLNLPLIFDKDITKKKWENDICNKIKTIFEKEVYGLILKPKIQPNYILKKEVSGALYGKCIRREIVIDFGEKKINLLLYLPKGKVCKGIFIGLNFHGNHTVTIEQDIEITTTFVNHQIIPNKTSQEIRSLKASRWPLEIIVEKGYGVATAHYGDFFIDSVDDYKIRLDKFVKAIGYDKEKTSAISIWASMLIEIADYFKQNNGTTNIPLIVFGHSRLGKTALVAGAFDKRFDMVISNDSGCVGAKIFKRKKGETIESINNEFPHWFNDNFKKYNNRDTELDFDQHMLLSLIAPRPLYIASAIEDSWADPEGEFLSAQAAEKAYKLYGYQHALKDWPKVNEPVGKQVRYHVRSGKHDLTEYDFRCFIDMANDLNNFSES